MSTSSGATDQPAEGLAGIAVKTWEQNILFSVLVELTYRCNLDCSFCYNDTSLKGTALSKEQYFERNTSEAKKLGKKAISLLEQSLMAGNANAKNSNLLSQTYRALALTAETLCDGPSVARYLAEWRARCPDDMHFESEYERLRSKFPGFLTRLRD